MRLLAVVNTVAMATPRASQSPDTDVAPRFLKTARSKLHSCKFAARESHAPPIDGAPVAHGKRLAYARVCTFA